jgi:phospho-N-acetylmuramoyl-pentapeptide-transferase
MSPLVPPRPDLSLIAIVGYSFLAFVIGVVLTPLFVKALKHFKLGKQLRAEAVDGGDVSVFLSLHKSKAGTPTMGGLLIWGSILLTVLISRALSLFGTVDHSLLQRGQVYIPLAILVMLGVLGALDDYLNILSTDSVKLGESIKPIKRILMAGILFVAVGAYYFSYGFSDPSIGSTLQKSLLVMTCVVLLLFLGTLFDLGGKKLNATLSRLLIGTGKKAGLNAIPKLLFLISIGLFAALWFYFRLDYQTINVPFGPLIGLPETLTLGWLYIPFFIFVLIATANAVNVTDGLDGLAGGLLILAFSAFGVLAFMQGLFVLAGFCGVIIGSIAAFLWYNVPPALFFMGDTGSLALGGTLAVISFMIDQVLLLPIIGFIFVMETCSVLLQLASKRLRNGKKIFRSAPIHHHFEALGWGESKVTMRFWIIGMFMALMGVIVGLNG